MQGQQVHHERDHAIYHSLQPPHLNQYLSQSSSSSREDIDTKRQDKSRVATEELPPSHHFPHRQRGPGPQDPQAQNYYGQHDHSQQSLTMQQSPSVSTTPVKLSPSDSHVSNAQTLSTEQHSHDISAAFRALPLLPTDLPHTTVTVSHSFVRPNDRGKEVLSFIVYVNPGNSKDGWKVEKMYSDVLGLDQRVRSSVGKGVWKRIATLPEGKLWKDHAPAKVDQRKVGFKRNFSCIVFIKTARNSGRS
jgi:RalA-binding protein 1